MTEVVAKSGTIVLMFEDWMFEELMGLVKAAHEENPVMRLFKFSEPRAQQMIANAILLPSRVCGFACVEMEQRKIIGLTIGMTAGLNYSDEPIVSDVFTFIAPEHRHSGEVRAKLLDSLSKWAKGMGITKVFFVNMQTIGEPAPEGWTKMGERLLHEVK